MRRNRHEPDNSPHPTPIWVGQVETTESIADLEVPARYDRARLLVTVSGVPAGQVTLDGVGGVVRAHRIRAAVEAQLRGAVPGAAAPLEPTSRPIAVVIPTRGRPESLSRCVSSVLRSDHPELRVLVVDNDPEDDATERVVAELGDPRVEYVREPRRGTSAARNRGIREAGGLVAFTDDDVEVDPGWAGRMAAALATSGAACVCGPVYAARLDTPAQLAADDGLGWRRGHARRRYSLRETPTASPVFPFSPGLFGVGANLAVDTDVIRDVGAFDPALGPGTPALSGEDCDFTVRLVLAGHTVAFEPSAFVWHHHRAESAELAQQLAAYAVGLGAFLTKIACDPVARRSARRRVLRAATQLRSIAAREASSDLPGSSVHRRLRTVMIGPIAYLRGRRALARSLPSPAFQDTLVAAG